MPTDLSTIDSPCDPVLDIGTGCDVVCAGSPGDTVDKVVGWDTSRIDPETLLETCEWDPADFTGYVPAAYVLDANGAVLQTMSVTPAVGDDTGTFRVVLDGGFVDAALRDAAVRWKFTLTAGTFIHTLVLAKFRVT